VSTLETIVKELTNLPPHKLALAANYVQGLREVSHEERMAAFEATAGSLSTEEAGELERVIEESCERIDPSDW